MNNKKTNGIQIFGFLLILCGVITFLFALHGIVMFEGKLTALLRIISTLFALVYFTVGVGILKLKEWARKAIIFLSIIISIRILTMQDIITKENIDLTRLFILIPYMLLCVSPLIYFTRPKVKEQFK